MTWPNVLDEEETLDRVLAGESLARFGDGEFNLIFGGICKTQSYVPPIGASLKYILSLSPCLVGVPRQGIGPKAAFWQKYNRPNIVELLTKPLYGSSLVTRPDSVPWIDRPTYWKKVKSLWQGKNVTLVRGSGKSLTASMLKGASSVREILCPGKEAYSLYWKIRDRIGDDRNVLLCLGPTATILAADLSLEGRHAVDLGHIGMFLGKHERGEPMVVTRQDKMVDQYA